MLILANSIVLFAVWIAAVQGGGLVIQGQVTSEDALPLVFVRVRLEGFDYRSSATSYTDPAGRFRFTGVSQGTYHVVVSLEGFEEVRERVVVPQFGNTWISVRRKSYRPADENEPAIGGRATVDIRQLSIPQNAVREYEKAQAAWKEGDVARAMKRFRNAMDIAPRFYEAAVELARLYIDRKEYDTAVDVLRSKIPAESSVGDAAFYLGYAYYNLRQNDAAEQALFRSLESDLKRPEARLLLANIFIRKAQAKKALEQIEAYLEENPDSGLRTDVEQKRLELLRFLDK
jgi:tetratricopeptide (TPR) repeat protein